MFDVLEDQYRWDSVNRLFVLLEDDPGMFDFRPRRVDVQAARLGAGWALMTTVECHVNAQPGVIDVWIRVVDDISMEPPL